MTHGNWTMFSDSVYVADKCCSLVFIVIIFTLCVRLGVFHVYKDRTDHHKMNNPLLLINQSWRSDYTLHGWYKITIPRRCSYFLLIKLNHIFLPADWLNTHTPYINNHTLLSIPCYLVVCNWDYQFVRISWPLEEWLIIIWYTMSALFIHWV